METNELRIWRGLTLICPNCKTTLRGLDNGWECPKDAIRFSLKDGIPDFILPHRSPKVEMFLHVYQSVRDKEGWGSKDPDYYSNLPYKDKTGNHKGVWRIRRRSYELLRTDLLHSVSPGSRILDVGAGNGWLSGRLAKDGYFPHAVDVNLDIFDGLRAIPGVENGVPAFPVLRAEFDYLPFHHGEFDAMIFNASIHYSADLCRTVERSFHCLKTEGILYVMDSPFYQREVNGNDMLDEKAHDIESKSGVPVSPEFLGTYLSPRRLEEIERLHSVEILWPRPGVRRRIRQGFARLLGQREPAMFPILKIRNQSRAITGAGS